ncbi:MAG: polymerase beta, Nucleotidyltransferase [Pseudomonadota bacterium]|jgi:predicted nucleotidyltransferase
MTVAVDPLEERIRARQRSDSALGQARLARLPRAVALLMRLGVERVWLFGSLATGTTHADSDVDLMVKGLPASERTNAWLQLEETRVAERISTLRSRLESEPGDWIFGERRPEPR